MSTITITINVDNDAFANGRMGEEASRLIHDAADEISQYTGPVTDSSPLRDANGNTVGEWRMTA